VHTRTHAHIHKHPHRAHVHTYMHTLSDTSVLAGIDVNELFKALDEMEANGGCVYAVCLYVWCVCVSMNEFFKTWDDMDTNDGLVCECPYDVCVFVCVCVCR